MRFALAEQLTGSLQLCRHSRRGSHQPKAAPGSQLDQLLTLPPVLREDFVNPKLASKLAQQLKVCCVCGLWLRLWLWFWL